MIWTTREILLRDEEKLLTMWWKDHLLESNLMIHLNVQIIIYHLYIMIEIVWYYIALNAIEYEKDFDEDSYSGIQRVSVYPSANHSIMTDTFLFSHE
jgi:hypothetical protein